MRPCRQSNLAAREGSLRPAPVPLPHPHDPGRADGVGEARRAGPPACGEDSAVRVVPMPGRRPRRSEQLRGDDGEGGERHCGLDADHPSEDAELGAHGIDARPERVLGAGEVGFRSDPLVTVGDGSCDGFGGAALDSCGFDSRAAASGLKVAAAIASS